MYAARKVLDALGTMCVNAKSVMDWLNECARDIAQHGAFATDAFTRSPGMTLVPCAVHRRELGAVAHAGGPSGGAGAPSWSLR